MRSLGGPSGRPLFVTLALSLAGLGALVLAFVWLRLPPEATRILNIDEFIPIAVSDSMDALGRLDPNWTHADLPDFFRYDQYNFYLYMIVGHVAQLVGGWFGGADVTALRVLNIVLQGAAAILLVDGLRRRGVDLTAILATAVATAFAPSLIPDAVLARPESLVFFLTALCFWFACLNTRLAVRAALIGFTCGLGAAVKLTFPAVGAAALVALWAFHRPSLKTLSVLGAATAAGAMGGFVLGAPYALIHFDVFLNGLQALARQYDGLHPPHSALHGWPLSSLFWTLRHFVEFYGLWIAVAVAGVYLADRQTRWAILALLAPMAVYIAYFSTKTVFFERNFAAALPLVFVAFGLGFSQVSQRLGRHAVRLPLLAVIAAPGALIAAQIAEAAYSADHRLAEFVSRNGLSAYAPLPVNSFTETPPPPCGQFVLQTYNDQFTARYQTILEANGYIPVARFQSRFAPLAASTLHTYFESSFIFYEKPCAE